jgi:MoxR-like ATPase
MLTRYHERKGAQPAVERVLGAEELQALQAAAAAVRCDPSVLEYVVRLTRATRESTRLKLGASPRSSQGLLAAAKARASLNGRDFATPDDVKEVAPSVLNHRLMLKAEAEVVEVPR